MICIILTLTPNGATTCQFWYGWYQTEGLEKIWEIKCLKWTLFVPNLHPTLECGHKGSAYFEAIFSINSNVLKGPLRKYNFILFSKWNILNPGNIMV